MKVLERKVITSINEIPSELQTETMKHSFILDHYPDKDTDLILVTVEEYGEVRNLVSYSPKKVVGIKL